MCFGGFVEMFLQLWTWNTFFDALLQAGLSQKFRHCQPVLGTAVPLMRKPAFKSLSAFSTFVEFAHFAFYALLLAPRRLEWTSTFSR